MGQPSGTRPPLHLLRTVLRIRIRRILMFLHLPHPDLGPLVRATDPDHQAKIVRKTLIPTVLFCFEK
jgi:hypothetical protein